MAEEVNPWAWWLRALETPQLICKGDLMASEGHPEQGFYRVRNGKGGAYEPVAIWRDDTGEWVALRSGKIVDAIDIWTWVIRNPVTAEAYNAVIEGGRWPDDDETVSAQISPPTPGVGDNSGEVSEDEKLKDQIEAALENAKKYAVIKDDETSTKALSLRNRLNELSGNAAKIHKKQKEPYLEGGRVVDRRWKPLIESSKAGADTVRDAIGKWETEKLAKQRKAERDAEQARIAAEKAKEAVAGETGNLLPAEPETAPAPTYDPAPATIKPTYGKAASVKAVTVLDEVKDWAALAVYMSTHGECQDLLKKLAQRAIDAGRTVPGITTKEEAKVR